MIAKNLKHGVKQPGEAAKLPKVSAKHWALILSQVPTELIHCRPNWPLAFSFGKISS